MGLEFGEIPGRERVFNLFPAHRPRAGSGGAAGPGPGLAGTCSVPPGGFGRHLGGSKRPGGLLGSPERPWIEFWKVPKRPLENPSKASFRRALGPFDISSKLSRGPPRHLGADLASE